MAAAVFALLPVAAFGDEPVGRAITSVTASPDGWFCELEFEPDGANDVRVWAVADTTDRGTGDKADWSMAMNLGILPKDVNKKKFTIPLDWHWGTELKAMRFLTTPAYDATLTGLVGNRTAADIGPYIDTGYTPSLTDKLVADLKTATLLASPLNQHEAIFSARKNNTAKDKTMTLLMCHVLDGDLDHSGCFRFDYGTYDNQAAFSKLWSPQLSETTRYTVTLNKNVASVEDLMGATSVNGEKGPESGNALGSLLLFATQADSSGKIVKNHIGQFTLYSFKWFGSDGELKHEFIPVVSDGVNTLYDTVEGKLMAVSKVGAEAGDFGAEGDPLPVDQTTFKWSDSISRNVSQTSVPMPVAGRVTTNEMAYSWGYIITGLPSETPRCFDTVLVFTKPGEELKWSLPKYVSTIDYLIVGGGGSGGRSGSTHGAGGGGAGEMIDVDSAAISSGDLTVTVGKGGAGIIGTAQGGNLVKGNNGEDSILQVGSSDPIAAKGGGGGGVNSAGNAGGSGGGAGCRAAGKEGVIAGGGSTATLGYGNAGGSGNLATYRGGGGGGAGSAGCDWNVENGKGGSGRTSDITGSDVWCAAGGGGAGISNGGYGLGGDGGGGTGSHYLSSANTYGEKSEATSGTTFGSGGGGTARAIPYSCSGAGCQGVVVVRFACMNPGLVITVR